MINRKKKSEKQIRIDISEEELLKRIEQIEAMSMDSELQEFVVEALWALLKLDKLMGMKETTLARLRKIFNKKSEKHLKEKIPSPTENPSEKKEKREGSNQGKNGKEDYPGAKKNFIPMTL